MIKFIFYIEIRVNIEYLCCSKLILVWFDIWYNKLGLMNLLNFEIDLFCLLFNFLCMKIVINLLLSFIKL